MKGSGLISGLVVVIAIDGGVALLDHLMPTFRPGRIGEHFACTASGDVALGPGGAEEKGPTVRRSDEAKVTPLTIAL